MHQPLLAPTGTDGRQPRQPAAGDGRRTAVTALPDFSLPQLSPLAELRTRLDVVADRPALAVATCRKSLRPMPSGSVSNAGGIGSVTSDRVSPCDSRSASNGLEGARPDYIQLAPSTRKIRPATGLSRQARAARRNPRS
jgi:hypothetical protein